MRIHVSSSHDHCWQGSTQVHAKKNDLSLSGDDVHTVLLALQGHDLSKLLTWPLPPHVADVASFPFPFPLTPLKTRMRNGAKFLMFVFLRTLYTVGNTSRSRDPRGPRASPRPAHIPHLYTGSAWKSRDYLVARSTNSSNPRKSRCVIVWNQRIVPALSSYWSGYNGDSASIHLYGALWKRGRVECIAGVTRSSGRADRAKVHGLTLTKTNGTP